MRSRTLARAGGSVRADGVRIMAGAAEVPGAGMNRKRRYDKTKRDGHSALALPHCVLDSSAYLATSAYARMLLVDMGKTYNGFNNGRLSCTYQEMQARGWRSKATLHKAKKELLRLGLIQETRKGRLPNTCALYALTWCALDDGKGSYDIADSAFRRGAYAPLTAPPVGDGAGSQFANTGNKVLVPPRGPQWPATWANEPTKPQPLGPPRGPVAEKKAHSLARHVGTLIDYQGGAALSRSGGALFPERVTLRQPSPAGREAMRRWGLASTDGKVWTQPASLSCKPVRETGTEPNRQPETPDTESVELVYEPVAELVPDFDESQDVGYEIRQASQ
jgi:hypothetical protein